MWVQEPGLTQGRGVEYENTIVTCLVINGILAHILTKRTDKEEGGVELVYTWRNHNLDYKMMHCKVDIIARNMAIHFCSSSNQ